MHMWIMYVCVYVHVCMYVYVYVYVYCMCVSECVIQRALVRECACFFFGLANAGKTLNTAPRG
jgi:hypothetical protein